MKATAIGVIAFLVIAAFAASCFAGQSRGHQTLDNNLKMALHIKSHNAKQTCDNLPAIEDLGDITRTATGDGDYDIFMVIFDYGTGGYTGAEFGLSWPGTWTSATTTHCADFAIDGIVNPGDVISLTWSTCQAGPASGYSPIAWSWITVSGPGEIMMVYKDRVEPFGPILGIVDCDFQEQMATYVYFAAVDETPWDGEPYPATEPTTWGGIKSMFR